MCTIIILLVIVSMVFIACSLKIGARLFHANEHALYPMLYTVKPLFYAT